MSASADGSVILLTMSMICQASRRCSIASTSFLYSAASALVSSVGSGRRRPRSLDPQRRARAGRAGADVGAALAADAPRRPPPPANAADLHDRGDHAVGGVAVVQARGDQQLAVAVAGLRRVDGGPGGSSSSIGTTMPGSTIGSLTNSTGTEIASVIQSSKVEPDALNPGRGCFVPTAPAPSGPPRLSRR